MLFEKVFNDNSYSAQLVTMQMNDEGKTVVTGIVHSSRLGMYEERKVIIHKMNNFTDEVLSWVQENVKFCNSCPCTLANFKISCQQHFLKKFPQDIDDHCPGLLNDEIKIIKMKHQDVATFDIESIYQYSELQEVDFSFNNLTELVQNDKTLTFPWFTNVTFNFSHNRIEKITDGFLDNFMGLQSVDLSSNPKTTIFTQSPIIAFWKGNGKITRGNFTTYFGNEKEVRPILDNYCNSPNIRWLNCYVDNAKMDDAVKEYAVIYHTKDEPVIIHTAHNSNLQSFTIHSSYLEPFSCCKAQFVKLGSLW